MQSPAPREDRQGRGDRSGAPATQATIQSPANRGNWQGRGDRSDPGYWRGRDNRGDWNNNRNDNGRGADRRDWGNRSDFNRDGRTDYRSDYRRGVNYGGPRHDFSGFRDYHRNYYPTRRFNVPYYRRPAGWYEHRWRFGEFLPIAFWGRDYWLVDFEVYDLPPPPYGAVWVRVGNDALLVDEDSGEIITVAYSVFY
jgi:Ni/Co efflux regulator RcnB